MKKILLTGGSGFIGRNIIESLMPVMYKIISPRHSELDLADEQSVDNYFKKNEVDIVIHTAVKPGHRNAIDTSNLYYTNTRMFFNLERHSKDYEKMIVIGSGAIYDNRYYRPKMKEEEWVYHLPSDEHGFCKYACEKVIEHSENIYDLRVFGVFGKYEDYAIRFISNAICKAVCDLPITIKQDRNFDYIYVEDLIPVLDWFINNTPSHHAYNITPDSSIALSKLAEIVRSISGKSLEIKIEKSGMDLEYSGDNQLIKKEFDDYSMRPIESSIEELYEWYNENKNSIEKNRLMINK